MRSNEALNVAGDGDEAMLGEILLNKKGLSGQCPYFDLSIIPDDAIITSAQLRHYPYSEQDILCIVTDYGHFTLNEAGRVTIKKHYPETLDDIGCYLEEN